MPKSEGRSPKWLLLAALGILHSAIALGQQEDPWSLPREAAATAHIDAAALPAFDRPFQRYLWFRDGRAQSLAAGNYGVNLAANGSRVLFTGAPVGDDLLRLDMRLLDPDGTRFTGLWERLSAGPDFHVSRLAKVKVAPFKATDGRTYEFRMQAVREFALHAGPNDLLSLSTFTGSKVPIVEARYFLTRLLTTVDQGLGDGLYYQFCGIDLDPAGETTALEAWLARQGVDPTIAKVLQGDSSALKVDPRNQVAVSFSGVTGKPRAVILIYGAGVRPTDGVPIVTLTLDIADGQVDAKQHPILTLLDATFAGGEGIGFRPDGFPEYIVFNAAGQILASVPDNIARDGTVPFPYTARLQAAIGCIRCHADGEGWKTLKNDVATLLASGLTPIDDDSQTDPVTALDKILGLYTGDPAQPIQTLRNAHDGLAFRATGGIWLEKSATGAAGELAAMYAQYNYELIGPAEALRELGQAVLEDETAEQAFARVIPKLPALPETGGFPAEDPSIGLLRAGIGMTRFDFNRVLPDLYLRSQAATDPAQPLPVPEGLGREEREAPLQLAP